MIGMQELRECDIDITSEFIEIKHGIEKLKLRFEDIQSCFWTDVRKWKMGVKDQPLDALDVILIFTYFSPIGNLSAAIHWIRKLPALDIQTNRENYIIVSKKEELTQIHDSIRIYQTKHGIETAKLDMLLEDDDYVYDTVERALTQYETSDSPTHIEACSRCGSLDLIVPSTSNGFSAPFDSAYTLQCEKCGQMAPPIQFASQEEYEQYLEGTKDRSSD